MSEAEAGRQRGGGRRRGQGGGVKAGGGRGGASAEARAQVRGRPRQRSVSEAASGRVWAGRGKPGAEAVGPAARNKEQTPRPAGCGAGPYGAPRRPARRSFASYARAKRGQEGPAPGRQKRGRRMRPRVTPGQRRTRRGRRPGVKSGDAGGGAALGPGKGAPGGGAARACARDAGRGPGARIICLIIGLLCICSLSAFYSLYTCNENAQKTTIEWLFFWACCA